MNKLTEILEAKDDKIFQTMRGSTPASFIFLTERGRVFEYMATGHSDGIVREHDVDGWNQKTADEAMANMERLAMEARAASGMVPPETPPKKRKSSLILASTPELVGAELEGSPESAE